MTETITVDELLAREGLPQLKRGVRPPRHLILDTFYVTFPQDSPRHRGWITVVAPDWDSARAAATCRWGPRCVLTVYKPEGREFPAGEVLRVVVTE